MRTTIFAAALVVVLAVIIIASVVALLTQQSLMALKSRIEHHTGSRGRAGGSSGWHGGFNRSPGVGGHWLPSFGVPYGMPWRWARPSYGYENTGIGYDPYWDPETGRDDPNP